MKGKLLNLENKKILGDPVARAWKIEYQKRGLPRLQSLLLLKACNLADVRNLCIRRVSADDTPHGLPLRKLIVRFGLGESAEGLRELLS